MLCGLESAVFTRVLALTCVLGAIGVAADPNWPRFRGPNGSGQSGADAKLPTEWTEASSAWSAQLPGEGNSSPVIWGERVFVTSAVDRGEQRVLMCFDISDAMTWFSVENPVFSSIKGAKVCCSGFDFWEF